MKVFGIKGGMKRKGYTVDRLAQESGVPMEMILELAENGLEEIEKELAENVGEKTAEKVPGSAGEKMVERMPESAGEKTVEKMPENEAKELRKILDTTGEEEALGARYIREEPARCGEGEADGWDDEGYTLEEFEVLSEQKNMELIDGMLFEMNAPELNHQDMAFVLGEAIHNYIRRKRGECRMYLSPDVRLDRDDRTIVQPDVR